jgi:hypothetical protein
MPGGKGKSVGGKAGAKDAAGKTQKSHSAKAGLQVSISCVSQYYAQQQYFSCLLVSLATASL